MVFIVLCSATIFVLQTERMAEYILAVLNRLNTINLAISHAEQYRNNLPDALEILNFDADLQVQLLEIQRHHLISILEVQVLLALMWIIIIEQ